MPVYEYQCEECATRFDVRRSFSDETPARCPRCEGQARRLFAAVPVIFNGSGFYVTDNRKNGSTPEKEKSSSASPETAGKH
jgi:putative FmdB family regulatory protein